jgi:hypothetical protein
MAEISGLSDSMVPLQYTHTITSACIQGWRVHRSRRDSITQLSNLNSDQSRVLWTKYDLHMQALALAKEAFPVLNCLAPHLYGIQPPMPLETMPYWFLTCHSCMTPHMNPTNQN